MRRLLRDATQAHVATVDPDGTAHVVPLWFVWLEDAVFLTTRHGSRVEANLRRTGTAAVAIDRGVRWIEQHGALLRGPADLLEPDHASARRALSTWFEKYREHLSGPGFRAYTEQVERPLVARVRPVQVSWWSHAGGGQ